MGPGQWLEFGELVRDTGDFAGGLTPHRRGARGLGGKGRGRLTFHHHRQGATPSVSSRIGAPSSECSQNLSSTRVAPRSRRLASSSPPAAACGETHSENLPFSDSAQQVVVLPRNIIQLGLDKANALPFKPAPSRNLCESHATIEPPTERIGRTEQPWSTASHLLV